MLNKTIISLIRLYQHTLSPDHGFMRTRHPLGFCRFYPTCSEYTIQAISAHGTFRGIFLGFLRVLRCNPWASPRVDHPQ